MNKVIVIILVLLLLFCVAVGFYSYDLNKQVISLSNELAGFRGETTTQVGTLSDELAGFRGETVTQIDTLSDEVTGFRGETATQIDTLSDELTSFRGEIDNLSDELTSFKGETTTQIDALSDELKGVSGEISRSVINVSKIYEKVKGGVVVVSDGKNELGSGFVFDANGYIVTNYHVVEGVYEIEVVSHDGATSQASIIGSSKYSDIAVLKLKGEANLEPLELGDSDDISVGEPVIVIGSPFNLPGTVTSGIISQKGRAAVVYAEKEPYYLIANLIQYSAASNPGSSGGPLLNSRGEVIGAVTAKVVLGEQINYAISSNKVKRVARSLIDRGYFRNPTLPGNWKLAELTPEKARAKNLETTDGILVIEADKRAVFEADNVIVAVDGVTVRVAADLFNYLGEYKSPGETVTLTTMSHNAKEEISVELVEGGVVLSDETLQPQ